MIGSEVFLKPLFLESVEVKASYREGTSIAYVQLINNSDFNFACDYTGDYGLYNSLGFITIRAHATTVIGVKTNEILENFPLEFVVHNAITAPGKKLEIEVPVKIETAM